MGGPIPTSEGPSLVPEGSEAEGRDAPEALVDVPDCAGCGSGPTR